jgi:hypothetical protein
MRLVPSLVLSIVVSSCAPRPAADPARWIAPVERLAAALQSHYVFPEVAEYAAEMLRRKLARGGYRQATPGDLAAALTHDLQALAGDRQLAVRFDPQWALVPRSPRRSDVLRAEVLPGNVGLLEVRSFTEQDPALAAALQRLGDTDALVVDVRRDEGGTPEAVAALASAFFPEGSRVHLGDVYFRARHVLRPLWTDPDRPGPRYDNPVYVLTSARTSRAGAQLAYDLRSQGRATIVGETTGGEAYPAISLSLAGGLVAVVPAGEMINAATGTSWQGVGVTPDRQSPAALALTSALQEMLASERDACRRSSLEEALARVARNVQHGGRNQRS